MSLLSARDANCQTCRAEARSRWINVNAVVTAIRQHLEEGHPDAASILLLRLEAVTLKEANRFAPIAPAETRRAQKGKE